MIATYPPSTPANRSNNRITNPGNPTSSAIQKYARLAAVLYLLITALAVFVHFYVPGQLIVAGDAVTTAENLRASSGLFRVGIAAELLLLLCEVALSLILYVLLRPVHKSLSLIAAVARLVMTTVHGANMLAQLAVFALVSGAGYLAAFDPEQLGALAMVLLEASSYGFSAGIFFLTLHAAVLGYLIVRSGYFPKVIGVLFMIAAVGYLIDSLCHVLIPGYVTGAPVIAIPIALSEIAFPLWLLFKGVNAGRWNASVGTAASA